MNFIKRFILKRKANKLSKKFLNYGEFSVECIYHDHFVKIMNNIIQMKNNQDLLKVQEVFTHDDKVKTNTKNEDLNLHARTGLFKTTVLYSIYQLVQEHSEAELNSNILEFSNIILKITFEHKSSIILDYVKIAELIYYIFDRVYVEVDSDNRVHIFIADTCYKFFNFELEFEKQKLFNNKLAISIVECINSVIPKYNTINGNMYFKGFEDNVTNSIKPYKQSEFQVQVLSNDFDLLYKNYSDIISDKRFINKMSNIYLIIDNAGKKLENLFMLSDAFIRISDDINRYIIKLNYGRVNDFIKHISEAELTEVEITNRDNIISTLSANIPHEVFQTSSENMDIGFEYDNVDEII